MVNGRLASLHGIAGVEGFQIREVALPPETPYGSDLDAVCDDESDGQWDLDVACKAGVCRVAERLLGIKIPPPPANIEPIDPDTRGAKTLREQLAMHSQKGSCKVCHGRFDPYGVLPWKVSM